MAIGATFETSADLKKVAGREKTTRNRAGVLRSDVRPTDLLRKAPQRVADVLPDRLHGRKARADDLKIAE